MEIKNCFKLINVASKAEADYINFKLTKQRNCFEQFLAKYRKKI